MKKVSLTLLVGVVYLLHQDCWNWKAIQPLTFGFLPVGLAYHVGYSLLATVLMAVLVRFAWPSHLDEDSGTSNAGSNHPEASQ